MQGTNNGLDAGDGLRFFEEVGRPIGVAVADVVVAFGAAVKDDGNGSVTMEGAQPVEKIGAALEALVVVEQDQGWTGVARGTVWIGGQGEVLEG